MEFWKFFDKAFPVKAEGAHGLKKPNVLKTPLRVGGLPVEYQRAYRREGHHAVAAVFCNHTRWKKHPT